MKPFREPMVGSSKNQKLVLQRTIFWFFKEPKIGFYREPNIWFFKEPILVLQRTEYFEPFIGPIYINQCTI